MKAFTTTAAPSTMAAIATRRRARGLTGVLTSVPGGRETELGFCAGVSSLLGARRTSPGAAETRESRRAPGATPDELLGRVFSPASALAPADGAGGSFEFRATTSAGVSNPVWVTVRAGASAALGREGVLRGRRECGREDAGGLEERTGLGTNSALPLSTLPATADELERPGLPLSAGALAAGGSDEERAPTV